MKLFDDLARLWWVRIPALLGRISGLLTSLASDGAYLRAWPAAAALAPIGCLLVGLLAGWTHFSNSYIALSYTNSLLLMALLTIFSGLGGGLGLWLLVGYIVGDFLLFGHGEYMGAPSAQIMAVQKRLEAMELSPDEKAQLGKIAASQKNAVALQQQATKMKTDGFSAEAERIVRAEYMPAAKHYLGTLRELVELERHLEAVFLDEVKQARQVTVRIGVVFIVVLLAGILVIGIGGWS